MRENVFGKLLFTYVLVRCDRILFHGLNLLFKYVLVFTTQDKRYRRDFARLELARLKFRFFFSLSDLDVLQNRFCHFKFARL